MTTVDCVAEFHCITSSARTRDVLRSMGEFRTKRDGRHFTSPLDHGQEKHFRIASSTIKNLHEGAVQVACGFLNADVRVAASRHATFTALGGVRRKQARCGPERSGQLFPAPRPRLWRSAWCQLCAERFRSNRSKIYVLTRCRRLRPA